MFKKLLTVLGASVVFATGGATTASAAPAPTTYVDVQTPVKMSASGDRVYVTTRFRCPAGSTYDLEILVTQPQVMQNYTTDSGTCTGRVQSASVEVAALPDVGPGFFYQVQQTYVHASLTLDGNPGVTDLETVPSLKVVGK
jgi:hypothetical protein